MKAFLHPGDKTMSEKVYDAKQLICIGLFGALAIVMPFLFHLVGLGSIFLPMFIPIVISGFFIQLRYAIILCIMIPILSFTISGMPPLLVPPIGIIMIFELLILIFFVISCIIDAS